jgi:hypothetical protein
VAAAGGAGTSLAFPIRAAFYYPWFPEAWKQGGRYPFTNFTPSAGFYDGTNASVVARHIADMRYAGMNAGIASWWGVGSKEDRRLPLLLAAAHDTPFKWSVYYEPEGYGDPGPARISADLAHLRADATDPAFLRVGGRAVVFVYAQPADACAMADRWASADTSGFYVVLKAFPGYARCRHQPDEWHQYNPAVRSDSQPGRSFTVSPGFHLSGDAERLARDPARFRADVLRMKASRAPFQLVTTFNEWGEGTAVESAAQWASTSGRGIYLDTLHLVLGPA